MKFFFFFLREKRKKKEKIFLLPLYLTRSFFAVAREGKQVNIHHSGCLAGDIDLQRVSESFSAAIIDERDLSHTDEARLQRGQNGGVCSMRERMLAVWKGNFDALLILVSNIIFGAA